MVANTIVKTLEENAISVSSPSLKSHYDYVITRIIIWGNGILCSSHSVIICLVLQNIFCFTGEVSESW